MGETRDELLRGARDASQRTLEKAKEVGRSAMDAASNAAQGDATPEDDVAVAEAERQTYAS